MFSGHTYALRGLVYREPKRLDIIANSGTRMRRIFLRHIFRLAPVQLRAAKYRLRGPRTSARFRNTISPQNKNLRALSRIDLRRENVAARVDREVVNPVEFAGLPAVAAERAQNLAGVAIKRAYLVVGAVGVEEPSFLLVGKRSRSQTEPFASVFFSTKNSFTNVPSLRKT
jgi:hypothetical protein